MVVAISFYDQNKQMAAGYSPFIHGEVVEIAFVFVARVFFCEQKSYQRITLSVRHGFCLFTDLLRVMPTRPVAEKL